MTPGKCVKIVTMLCEEDGTKRTMPLPADIDPQDSYVFNGRTFRTVLVVSTAGVEIRPQPSAVSA